MPKREREHTDESDPLPESRRRRRDVGATMMEYALIVSAVALVAVIGVAVFGEAVSDLFESIGDAF